MKLFPLHSSFFSDFAVPNDFLKFRRYIPLNSSPPLWKFPRCVSKIESMELFFWFWRGRLLSGYVQGYPNIIFKVSPETVPGKCPCHVMAWTLRKLPQLGLSKVQTSIRIQFQLNALQFACTTFSYSVVPFCLSYF